MFQLINCLFIDQSAFFGEKIRINVGKPVTKLFSAKLRFMRNQTFSFQFSQEDVVGLQVAFI